MRVRRSGLAGLASFLALFCTGVVAEELKPGMEGAVLRGRIDLAESSRRLGLAATASWAQVELQEDRDGFLGDPGQRRAEPLRKYAGRTDSNGNFVLAPRSQGLYTLTAAIEGHQAVLRRGLRIEANSETTLPSVLVLDLPPALTVRTTPVADPWQRPWQARLAFADRQVPLMAEARPTSEVGLVSFGDLEVGLARLEILDRDGKLWFEQLVDIDTSQREVFVVIDVVEVRGNVFLGSEPLAVSLSFGSTQGADIQTTSGEDGRFDLYLPREGKWAVEALWEVESPWVTQRLAPVDVRRRPGKTYAELQIQVPATHLSGRVLLEGEPAAGAGITVFREGPVDEEPAGSRTRREAVLVTDAKGRFALRGMEPGRLAVMAQKNSLSSDWTTVEIAENSHPELVLELREKAKIHGVLSVGPTPVEGGRIIALPSNPSPFRAYAITRTDPVGSFELEVPATTEAIDLLVAAPTLGLDLHHVRKQAGGWPNLVLDLGADGGSLRLQLAEAAATLDRFTSIRHLRHGAATMALTPIVETLLQQGDLATEGDSLIFRGLKSGDWTLCLAEAEAVCAGGELPVGGELLLTDPGPKAPKAPEKKP